MGFLIKFRTLETEYQVENLATSSNEVVLVNSQFSPIADTISIHAQDYKLQELLLISG